MDENEEKKKRRWRVLLYSSLAVLLAALVGLVTVLAPRLFPAAPPTPPLTSSTTSEPTVSTGPTLPPNPIDFAALQAKNMETVGWITIPNTPVNYPIMQSGNDRKENFYLDHTPEGEKDRAGSIYIQKINAQDFTNPNTVIYGHNMASGLMFASIRRYQNPGYFNDNRYITVYIPGHVLTYEVYSAFIYDNRHILNSFNFFVEEEYAAFLQHTLKPTSMVKQVRPGIEVTNDDRIITLSTCTARSSERFLVVGVLIDDKQTQ